MTSNENDETNGAFWVSTSEMAGVSTIVIQGELDLATAPLVTAKLEEAFSIPGSLVIDVTYMGFMDSSGLGILAKAFRRARTDGRSLALRNPSPPIRRTLEIAGLDFLIERRD
ncbi:MAG TPA: STAS domain-containing protein [Acidimicrobiales bacterium]